MEAILYSYMQGLLEKYEELKIPKNFLYRKLIIY
jgi:hypothetical protein